MIRRGFWLVTGAALGVTGYRKATRLARTVTGQTRRGGSAAAAPQAARAVVAGRPAARLASASRTAARPASGTGTAVARAVSAAGFIRDVRDGMAEYWDLHRGGSERAIGSRTLGSQGDLTSSGDSQQGRREP